MEEAEAAWAGRIQMCGEVIAKWEERMKRAESPAPSSRLQADDSRAAPASTSQFVWVGLTSAVDHMALAVDALEGTQWALRPFAYSTLCRTALLGSGQAVWVMTGTQQERLIRTLLIAEDEAFNFRTYLQDYRRNQFVTETVTEAGRTQLDREWERQRDLGKQARKRLNELGHPARDRFSATAMLQDVARVMDPDQEWLAASFQHEWRMASGDGHARLWPRRLRPESQVLPIVGDSRGGVLINKGSVQTFGMSLAAAVMVTSEALRLWDEHARESSQDVRGPQAQANS